MTTTATVVLPDELAPALAARVLDLLDEVPVVEAPDLEPEDPGRSHVCVVCHEGGKLGGHHGEDGRVEWIHKRCHRRLHRRYEPSRAEWRRIRAAMLVAC